MNSIRETVAQYIAAESAKPDAREAAPRIDVLLATLGGSQFRLVGGCLPFLPAFVEHCVLCPACLQRPDSRDTDCAVCDCAGYIDRIVCTEGDCDVCDRLHHVCFPGNDIDLRFLGMDEFVVERVAALLEAA